MKLIYFGILNLYLAAAYNSDGTFDTTAVKHLFNQNLPHKISKRSTGHQEETVTISKDKFDKLHALLELWRKNSKLMELKLQLAQQQATAARPTAAEPKSKPAETTEPKVEQPMIFSRVGPIRAPEPASNSQPKEEPKIFSRVGPITVSAQITPEIAPTLPKNPSIQPFDPFEEKKDEFEILADPKAVFQTLANTGAFKNNPRVKFAKKSETNEPKTTPRHIFSKTPIQPKKAVTEPPISEMGDFIEDDDVDFLVEPKKESTKKSANQKLSADLQKLKTFDVNELSDEEWQKQLYPEKAEVGTILTLSNGRANIGGMLNECRNRNPTCKPLCSSRNHYDTSFENNENAAQTHQFLLTSKDRPESLKYTAECQFCVFTCLKYRYENALAIAEQNEEEFNHPQSYIPRWSKCLNKNCKDHIKSGDSRKFMFCHSQCSKTDILAAKGMNLVDKFNSQGKSLGETQLNSKFMDNLNLAHFSNYNSYRENTGLHNSANYRWNAEENRPAVEVETERREFVPVVDDNLVKHVRTRTFKPVSDNYFGAFDWLNEAGVGAVPDTR